MKSAKITDILNFQIHQNYIELNDNHFYFFKYYPLNTTIYTDNELQLYTLNMQRLLDSLNCEVTFFITDKVQDLSAQKYFYNSLNQKWYHLTVDIINNIESTESDSASVQKSYYFIFKSKDLNQIQNIYNILTGKGFKVEIAEHSELGLLMRNYMSREFLNFDLLTFESEVDKAYDSKFNQIKTR